METSQVLSKSLIPYVARAASHSSAGASVEEAIQRAFVSLDERILGIAQAALEAGHPAGTAAVRAATGPAFAGSCALLLIYEAASSTLRIALAGDSRAVRAQYSSDNSSPAVVDVLSQDHNVNNEREYARIAAAHPDEEADDIMDRAYGSLLTMGTTRAFGDHRWKWPADMVMRARSSVHAPKPLAKAKTPPYMTAEPEVTMRLAVAARDFVILGSDGLWEAISNEDAVECVARWREARRAGKPEHVEESAESRYDVNEDGSLYRTARVEDFAIEDLDNAAVCLLKNVLGGRHRYMVAGAVTATGMISRYVRDDITVQVVFFEDP